MTLRMHTRIVTGTLAVLFILPVAAGAAETSEPYFSKYSKYETPVTNAGQRGGHITWNLGQTGLRGWYYHARDVSRDSREILIKTVEPGSPAWGKFQAYDIIVGVNGKRFDADARTTLGRAITAAETVAGKGVLNLVRWRNGEVAQVTLHLKVMGSYSATSPYNCPKTEKIIEDACAYLAKADPLGGDLYVGYSKGAGEAMVGLFLLASGDAKYLHLVRRAAHKTANSAPATFAEADHGMGAWRYGYQGLFLTEYYLATGDETVLEGIQRLATLLSQGQGNPGLWGHSLVEGEILGGYGAVNSCGLPCLMAMTLARECGAKVDSHAFIRSVKFFGRLTSVGGIPYGDHPAGPSSSSNGKNGMAAVIFALLGSEPAAAWFSRLAASTSVIDTGHTGNFFSLMWSHIGVVHAGPDNVAAFMKRFTWYRDLFRRADGSLIAQANLAGREGDLSTNHYVLKGPGWGSGGYGLMYAAGRKHIRMLGAPKSVFSPGAPSILAGALKLYRAKRYAKCRQLIEQLTLRARLTEETAAMAGQLDAAAQRNLDSIAVTTRIIAGAVKSGDLYRAKATAESLAPIASDTTMRREVRTEVYADPARAELLAKGQEYYAIMAQSDGSPGKRFPYVQFAHRLTFREELRERMVALAGDPAAGAYKQMALAALAANPKRHDLMGPRSERWRPVFTSEIDRLAELYAARVNTVPQCKNVTCRFLPLKDSEAATPPDWTGPAFDDKLWTAAQLPIDSKQWKTNRCLARVRFDAKDIGRIESLYLSYYIKGSAVIYLNGVRILRPVSGSATWMDYPVLLKTTTLELLKPGRNVLAIDLAANRGQLLDLSLDAVMKK